MAAQQSPLRRWKRFFPTFDTIDAAIVASQRGEEVGCAEVLREAKGDVVQILCDAPDDDPAEELCLILDELMAEYLVTLKTVPVTPSALASTDLAKAVGYLQDHESAQIRGLARDMVGMWRASVERDLAEAKASLEELRKLSDFDDPGLAPPKNRRSSDDSDKRRQANDAAPCTTKTARVEPAKREGVSAPQLAKKGAPVIGRAITAADIDKAKKLPLVVGDGRGDHAPTPTTRPSVVRVEPTKREVISAPPLPKKGAPVVGRASTAADINKAKKLPPVVGNGRGDHAGIDKMMESTKRKLRGGYQEAADAKRQRKIQVIQALKKLPEQSQQRKMHPIVRERSRAGCGVPTAAKRSLMPPAFQRT